MKKIYLAALIAGAALVSCNKEVKELPAPQEGTDLITITARIPDDDTRVGASVGFSWSWSAGDKLTVVSEEDSQVFTIKDGFSGKYAEFVGKPVKGDRFTILFPGEKANTADWSKQSQTGNGSVDHVQYAASLDNVDEYLSFAFSPEWAEEHKGALRQTGVIKMVLALPDTVNSVSHIALSSDTPLFYKGNGDAKVNKIELELTDAALEADHTKPR